MNDAEPTITAANPVPEPALDPIDTPTIAPGPGVPRIQSVPAVPGYEIECELGRGGMGVVYRARDTKLDRPVALKIVLGGGHAGAAALVRFLAEAKAAAAVRHPGIAQVYEFGEYDGLPFFAMEYCPGGNLAEKLAGTPLPPAQAAELVERVAEAVQAAHAAGIVHRDLKPANILLGEDRGPRTENSKDTKSGSSLSSVLCPLSSLSPKVSDFGLARRGDSGSGLTATGAVLGSPSYMAPEQAEGKKEIGPGADVYGLGAILYECLTGRPPFRASTPLETVVQVVSDDPVPPSRLVTKIPRDLETICLKCLQKDPRRRYASAAELADDLRRFLDGRPIAARPVGVIEKAWKAARRRPWMSFLLVTTVVSLCLLSVLGFTVATVIRSAYDQSLELLAQVALQRDAAEAQRSAAEAAKAVADEQRRKAEGRLLVALDAIERMMVRTASEKWARNPALQAERRAVLEEAVAVYRGFQGDDSKEPIVRRRQALAEVRVATAYLALADYAKAGEALADAETLQSQLASEFPNDPEYANDLALTLIQVGHLHVVSTHFETGIAYYNRAADEARRAVALAPTREEAKITLAEALTALGHFTAARSPDEGLKYHNEALALAREAAARPDPGYGARLFLAIGLLNVGASELGRGRARGNEMLAEAEGVFATLAGKSAPSARWADLYDIARSQWLTFQGTQLARAGDLPGALKKIDEGLAAADGLLAVQPKSFPVQIQKLNALAARLDVLGRLKRPQEARQAIAELISLSEGVAASSPSMAWVRPRFLVYRSLEIVYRAQEGQTAGLDKFAAELITLAPQTIDPDPAKNAVRDTVRYNVACAYAQASRFGEPEYREKAGARAVAELETLARAGHFTLPGKVALAETDPDLDPLRDRADFKQFLVRLKAPAEVAPPPRPAPGEDFPRPRL
jgi:serine/threonine protein kinase